MPSASDRIDEAALLMTEAASRVLSRLEERSRRERPELDALNAKGAACTRAAAPHLMLDVGPDVGRLLNVLARTAQARRVVEIGGSVGYSAIWLAAAVAEHGGEVISIEKDPGKAAEMQHNLAEARLAAHVRVVCDDADAVIPALAPPFDLVLIDHWKDRYISGFDLAWPKLRAGGVVIADNILMPAATTALMDAYVRHVRSQPDARSSTIPLGDGVEVTVRAAPSG
jgi:predicted O-methyltransferase YrrM